MVSIAILIFEEKKCYPECREQEPRRYNSIATIKDIELWERNKKS